MTLLCCALCLLSVGAPADAQIPTRGLIIDLDADRGVEVEETDRVAKWTNQDAPDKSRPATEFAISGYFY